MRQNTECRQINGEWVKTLRNELGLSQGDFAKRLDVSRSAVARWETGEVRPTQLAANALLQLAATVGDGQPEKRSSGPKKPKKTP